MVSKETQELLKFDQRHIVHGRYPIGKSPVMVIDKAKGIYFEDTEGKEYIDGGSQLVCVNLGYGCREILDAVVEQMEKSEYSTLFYGFSNRASIKCSEKLVEILPEGLDRFYFTTGGSESTETAFRLARLYWENKGSNRNKIISLHDSYHGVVFGALTATSLGKGLFHKGAGPLSPNFLRIPSYNCYHCMFGNEYPSCGIQCAQFLAEVIEREGLESVAAFIAESEQGTAGMVAPPPEYWPMVRKICNDYDVLLIADEVMTGFGRTGKMFAVEHWGIKPDMMTIAKGITSAYLPFGAVAFNDKVFKGLEGSPFASFTYSGHPVCAAAAVKAMEIYARDKVVENAAAMGKYARERLDAEFKPLPYVGCIDGLGLMLGIEIVSDKSTRRAFDPALQVMPKIQKEAMEAGLFLRITTIDTCPGDRICFAPPLVITKEEVDKILDILYPIVSGIKPN